MADEVDPRHSILKSTKINLNVLDDEDLDTELVIINHINSVLGDLNQLGLGPRDGFEIEDASSKWEDFYGTDKRYAGVRTYVYLRVRMLYDPPQTGPLMASMQKQIDEFAWRLNALRETSTWVDPNVSLIL